MKILSDILSATILFAIPLLLVALGVSAFLVASRFLSIFPVLYALRNGIRVSLLTSINLAQLSEFSLVIASLGLAAKLISQDTFTVIIFVFLIPYTASVYNGLSRLFGMAF